MHEELAFGGEWRRYQRAALAAFDPARPRTHIVAPPGSGKTLLGVELIRRAGRRALVLVPDAAVQLEWTRAVREFTRDARTASELAGADPLRPIACLSYQALTDIEDPDLILARLAEADGAAGPADLLSEAARLRVRQLRALAVGLVVLDECHNLASPWGHVVRAVLAELGDPHVVGLTSTAPASVRGEHAELYDELLGPVDFTVPTPAVVRDGHLAPYQELAWLTEPLPGEDEWLAKSRGLVEVVGHESATRGERLRTLVLCDTEGRTDDGPAACTAREALLALAADPRTAALRPLLISERGLLCAPADVDALLPALRERAAERFALPEWAAEPDGVLVALRSSGAEWMARAWIELATHALVRGTTRVLLGARALLGEGWDCAALNVLVDLTIADAPVQQTHGLTLRKDPADPGKVASNWDVVCVAPEGGDYERFAARQRQLYSPAQDGAIEAGPAHVHPELAGPAPPPAARLADISAADLARAADHDAARAAWRIGGGYRGVELATLLARPRADGPVDAAPAARAVADAYAALGELGAEAAASLVVAPSADGYARCALPGATPEEARRFVSALGELLGGRGTTNGVLLACSSGGGVLRRVLGRRSPSAERLLAVPADLAREPERAGALAAAWRRHVGPARVTGSGVAAPGGYDTLTRDAWV